MAKSKVGGTRAYIRGRIGSDVYSIGKNGKGSRQQVVRSLAEQVSNPRTTAQMAGRMIMSTVMQAASFLKPIIDHSFDGIAKGQPSISEFIRLNYAVLKEADGQYNQYQEKGIKVNALVVSKGAAVWPAGVTPGQNKAADSTGFGKYGVTIAFPGDAPTVGDLRALLNSASADDYITVIDIEGDDTHPKGFVRFHVNPALANSTALFDENFKMISNVFVTEAIGAAAEIVDDYRASAGKLNYIFLGCGKSEESMGKGQILSQKRDGSWIHSACTLLPSDAESNYDAALATYPVGTEQFLNGGDL